MLKKVYQYLSLDLYSGNSRILQFPLILALAVFSLPVCLLFSFFHFSLTLALKQLTAVLRYTGTSKHGQKIVIYTSTQTVCVLVMLYILYQRYTATLVLQYQTSASLLVVHKQFYKFVYTEMIRKYSYTKTCLYCTRSLLSGSLGELDILEYEISYVNSKQ